MNNSGDLCEDAVTHQPIHHHHDLRGVVFVVYNFHPVQEPAGAGLAVVVSDPQFLQDSQVDRRDVENILLVTKGREMSQA